MNTYPGQAFRFLLFSRFLNRWKTAKRSICYALLFALPSQAFVSCAGGRFLGIGRGNKYVYTYKMVAPIDSQSMTFQNDSLKVQFKIDDLAVRFQLQNLSPSVMTIQWDKVALGIDNAYSLVRHSVNIYADSALGKRSVPIPPLGYVQDMIVPVENVVFDGSQWVRSDLFPTTDGDKEEVAQNIQQNVGKHVVLIFPLLYGNNVREYRFEFSIVSVKRIPWRDARPAKPFPPPPTRKTRIELVDEITTAFIIVGMLGFVAFMISRKKEPVAE